jgi:hypothetical protein
MAAETYCIDASSLIKLKQDYPKKSFPGVWVKMSQLADSGRLISPIEVYKEIRRDDELLPWAKEFKKVFKRLDSEQIELVREIERRFPQLAKPGKFTAAADPFVVALAQLENRKATASLLKVQHSCCVVTEEGAGKQNIPAACAYYKVGCVTLVGLVAREEWVFV